MIRDNPKATDLFETARPRLFRLAYRMLASVSDAEDIVQDVYLRWRSAGSKIETPEAWLVTICSRLCIDRLRAAKRARALYEGPWLPEPIVTMEDASAEAERADDLTTAMLLVLERLSPRERAAYLLRQGFDYDYAEIAAILGASPTACRQLASRAARRLRDERPRFPASRQDARDLALRFGEAARSGDYAALMALLADDATYASDGGGKVLAARNVIVGADRVARFIIGVGARRGPDVEVAFTWVNGAPGFTFSRAGKAVVVIGVEIDDDRVKRVFATLNPDKLTRVPRSFGRTRAAS